MKFLLILLATSTIIHAQEKTQNKRVIDDQMIEIDIESTDWDISKNKGFNFNKDEDNPEFKKESIPANNDSVSTK